MPPAFIYAVVAWLRQGAFNIFFHFLLAQ